MSYRGHWVSDSIPQNPWGVTCTSSVAQPRPGAGLSWAARPASGGHPWHRATRALTCFRISGTDAVCPSPCVRFLLGPACLDRPGGSPWGDPHPSHRMLLHSSRRKGKVCVGKSDWLMRSYSVNPTESTLGVDPDGSAPRTHDRGGRPTSVTDLSGRCSSVPKKSANYQRKAGGRGCCCCSFTG